MKDAYIMLVSYVKCTKLINVKQYSGVLYNMHIQLISGPIIYTVHKAVGLRCKGQAKKLARYITKPLKSIRVSGKSISYTGQGYNKMTLQHSVILDGGRGQNSVSRHGNLSEFCL